MRTIAIFTKSLREQVRDVRGLAVSFLMPVMFMIIFGVVMGASFYTYPVLVLNEDAGVTLPDGSRFLAGDSIVAACARATYEDGTHLFTITPIASRDEVGDALERHDKVALVRMEARLSEAVARVADGAPSDTVRSAITISGDPSYPSFGIVRWMMDAVVREFLTSAGGKVPPVSVETVPVMSGTGSSEFDYMAPGLMLLAIFMLIIQSAVVLMREVESGTLRRLQLSRMRAWELLAGVSLSQIGFSIVMIPMMLGSAVLVGFHYAGSLLVAVLVGVVVCVSAIALGMITAGFSRTSNEAFLLGNLVIVPVIFLNGVFFPVPTIEWFRIAGHAIGPFELLPGTYAVDALNSVLLYGNGVEKIVFELVATLVLSGIYFAIGVWLFHRAHVRLAR